MYLVSGAAGGVKSEENLGSDVAFSVTKSFIKQAQNVNGTHTRAHT